MGDTAEADLAVWWWPYASLRSGRPRVPTGPLPCWCCPGSSSRRVRAPFSSSVITH